MTFGRNLSTNTGFKLKFIEYNIEKRLRVWPEIQFHRGFGCLKDRLIEEGLHC